MSALITTEEKANHSFCLTYPYKVVQIPVHKTNALVKSIILSAKSK